MSSTPRTPHCFTLPYPILPYPNLTLRDIRLYPEFPE